MLRKHLIVAASIASIGLASVVQADELQDDRWYVAPFGTFVKSGGDRNAKDGWGGGMGFGKMLDEHFNVELKGFYEGFSSERAAGGRWDLTGGTADLQYYFFRDKFSPYAVIGTGAMNTSFGGNSGTTFIAESGVGFTYELHDNFLLRSDVRYRYNNNLNAHLQPGTEEFHDMTVNVGFVVPFGAKPQAAVAEAAPEPVAAADCSTMDSDSDGVNDCLDQCPNTMTGSKVDSSGCPLQIELKGVQFDHDSAHLTEHAMTVLDGVAASLMATPQNRPIEVQGHTSSEGSEKYNLKLSQRRSQSVVDYLKSRGVTNALSARGYGESMPIADNSTEEGRMQNRRVELHWFSE